MVCRILTRSMVVALGTYLLLLFAQWGDEQSSHYLSKKTKVMLITGACLFAFRSETMEMLKDFRDWIPYGGLSIYLLFCSVTDHCLKKVYRFIQFPAVILLGVNLIQRGGHWQQGVEIILFAGIQYFLFMKLYGRGDGLAFMVCSLFFGILGVGIEHSLLHMSLTFLLLAVVQGIRGNIDKKGNLKEEVALLPYIAASFLMC